MLWQLDSDLIGVGPERDFTSISGIVKTFANEIINEDSDLKKEDDHFKAVAFETKNRNEL